MHRWYLGGLSNDPPLTERESAATVLRMLLEHLIIILSLFGSRIAASSSARQRVFTSQDEAFGTSLSRSYIENLCCGNCGLRATLAFTRTWPQTCRVSAFLFLIVNSPLETESCPGTATRLFREYAAAPYFVTSTCDDGPLVVHDLDSTPWKQES